MRLSPRTLFVTLCALVCLTSLTHVRADGMLPVLRGEDVCLLDPQAPDLARWTRRLRGPVEGLVARAESVTTDAGPALRCRLETPGGKGSPGLRFVYDEHAALFDTGLSGRTAAGLALDLVYRGQEYQTVMVHVAFHDSTIIVVQQTLTAGRNEFRITGGFRRATFPPDWRKVQRIDLYLSPSGTPADVEFDLHRIAVFTQAPADEVTVLRIEDVRETFEILPTPAAPAADGFLASAAWDGVAPLPVGAPLQARLCYDDTRLHAQVTAAFPTPPLSQRTEQDGQIWEDESLEFFFAGANDNERQIQFVINRDGVTFDLIRHYDKTADLLITDIHWDLSGYRMAGAYADGHWQTQFSFDLAEIGARLAGQPFMGFRMAQNYFREGFAHTEWPGAGRHRRTEPRGFGVLVFNRRPFGEGTLRIEGVRRRNQNERLSTFLVDCRLEGFAAATYAAETTLAVPGEATTEDPRNGLAIRTEELVLSGPAEERRTLTASSVPNRHGIYTVYVALRNPAGDARMAAVNILNERSSRVDFGERLLVPEPKETVWTGGAFPAARTARIVLDADATERTRRTARVFADELYGWTGARPPIETDDAAATGPRIRLRLAPAVTLADRVVQGRPEGYVLEITPEEVVITGFDEPGLYYGGVTFLQLLRTDMKLREDRPAPCGTILDWPDIGRRIVSLEHPHHIRAGKAFNDPITINFLKNWVNRYVAGVKANVFRWSTGAVVQFDARPEFNDSSKPYTLEDMAAFAEFCRDRFIDLCPTMQVGGHALHWLLPYHPELRETGYNQQADVLHPDHDKIVYACFEDVVNALKPRYFSAAGDEWWHSAMTGEKPQPLLRGRERKEVFLETHVKLHRWLKERGAVLQIYSDMLTPYHNGGRFEVGSLIDEYPRDIVLAHWSGESRKPEFFTEKGFPVWMLCNGFQPVRRNTGIYDGFGTIVYGFGDPWGIYPHRSLRMLWTPAVVRSMDFAWNLQRDEGDSIEMRIEAGTLGAWMHMLAVQPNPEAGSTVQPVDLQPVLQHVFNDYARETLPDHQGVTKPFAMPEGTRELGFLPMRLEAPRNCLVLKPGDAPAGIAIGRPAASLVFLHTVCVGNPKQVKMVGRREWPFGQPAGDYTVHYQDGTQARIGIRIGYNINPFDVNNLQRFVNEVRYIHILRDSANRERFLYQAEWVNPHPEKIIERVQMEHADLLDLDLVLFALSTRDRRTPRGTQTAVAPAVPGKPTPRE